jgi:2-polyprenyl-3-methyl-5-hydroxy-6-metoxy-1,4-benzoquinol methylase
VSVNSCLLCHGRDYRVFLTSYDRLFGIASGAYSLLECKACGLVRLDPLPAPEEVASFYSGSYWFAGGASAAGRLEEIYRRMVLRDHVRFAARAARDSYAPGTILDVGCSGGLFLRMMRERGFPNVLGLDFSTEAARVAREKNGVNVMVGDLTEADIPAQSCALVTMYHVVEHLLDPRAYLRSAARLLQPGGRLIVQVPDRDCWEASLTGANWTGLDVPRHIHVFRSRDLRRLLRDCGFEVAREKHFSLRDHPAGLASSLFPSLDPVARAIRHTDSSGAARLGKDLAYFGVTLAALPLTLLEALFGKGSSVMIEARKAEAGS